MIIEVGQTLICTETGKQFVASRDGCSFNYATDREGNIFSDEGVDARERRALLDRSKPFTCYFSSDGKRITGWKDNTLGYVVYSKTCKLGRLSFTHGKEYRSIVARDIHGGLWYGRGSPGICITLRAKKA
jgi:hypothetical protein